MTRSPILSAEPWVSLLSLRRKECGVWEGVWPSVQVQASALHSGNSSHRRTANAHGSLISAP